MDTEGGRPRQTWTAGGEVTGNGLQEDPESGRRRTQSSIPKEQKRQRVLVGGGRPPRLSLEFKSKNLHLCPKGLETMCFMQRGGPIRLEFHRAQSGSQVKRRWEGLGQGGGS